LRKARGVIEKKTKKQEQTIRPPGATRQLGVLASVNQS